LGKVIYLGVLLAITLGVSLGGQASAQEYNHIITVYATVAEQRAVYLDSSGNIIKVAGNTAKNITPAVFSADNKPVAMTDSVMSQYQQFLKEHDYHLKAGETYLINPLTVNTQPNTQTIKVAVVQRQPLTLSL